MGETKKLRLAADRNSGGLYADLCERIGSRLEKEMTVLELGCGSGQLSLPLCGNVSLWEAVDPSTALIAKARKLPHSDRLRFTVMDPASLSFEHSVFDAVIAVNAFLWLPQPDSVLREIRRVLRPGGLLLAPAYMLGGRRKRLIRRRINRTGLCRECTATEYIDRISRYGFAVEKAVLLPDRIAPLWYLEARNQE